MQEHINKLEYFIARTEKDFDEIKEKMDEMQKSLYELREFKVRLAGMCSAISIICSVLFNLFVFYWGHA